MGRIKSSKLSRSTKHRVRKDDALIRSLQLKRNSVKHSPLSSSSLSPKHPENILSQPMSRITYSIDGKRELKRARLRERRRMKRELKELHPHIPPETPPENKPVPPRFAKGQKTSVSAKHTIEDRSLLEHLTSINHDITDLMPQLMSEIDEVGKDLEAHGARFKGIITEKKLWKRFLHSYARFLGNISKSCDFCGISRNHFSRACGRYPTLLTLVKLINDRFIDEVEETSKKHSLLPNSVVERIFLLKVHRKEVYGEGDTKQPVSVEVSFKHLGALRNNPKIEVPIEQTSVGGQLPPSTSAE